MKKICLVLLPLIIIFTMTSCVHDVVYFLDSLYSQISSEDDYIKSSNWNCTNEEFVEEYIEYYNSKIEELKAFYGIECLEIVKMLEHDNDIIYIKQFYNDEVTIEVLFANRGLYGDYWVELYYFSENIDDLNNYEKQKKYVDFANDLTNAVAFDTKADGNHFEQLYMQCKEQTDPGGKGITDLYHFDEFVGDVGYKVGVQLDTKGYYYKMQKNKELEILANEFSFNGILKPPVFDS